MVLGRKILDVICDGVLGMLAQTMKGNVFDELVGSE